MTSFLRNNPSAGPLNPAAGPSGGSFLRNHPSGGPIGAAGGPGKGGKFQEWSKANPQFWMALAAGADNLSHEKNPTLQKYAMQAMGQKQEERRLDRVSNKTADKLEEMGFPDAAEMARNNPEMSGELFTKAWALKNKKPESTFSVMGGDTFNEQYGTQGPPDAIYKVDDVSKEPFRLGGGQTINQNVDARTPMPLTLLQEKIDEKTATQYTEWQNNRPDVYKNLNQMGEVVRRLGSGENMTGATFGVGLAVLGETAMAAFNPEAFDTRELAQEVAQRNLRIILGAQFAQKEGEMLISRVYNATLPEHMNAQRTSRLLEQMQIAAESKERWSAYIEKHGTTKGYEGLTQAEIERRFSDATRLIADEYTPKRIRDWVEVEELPEGALYIGPDGVTYRKIGSGGPR